MEGAITSEHCGMLIIQICDCIPSFHLAMHSSSCLFPYHFLWAVAIVAFERPAMAFSEATGFPDICITKVSERLDDITVVVQSCELEADTNLQFNCEFLSYYIQHLVTCSVIYLIFHTNANLLISNMS